MERADVLQFKITKYMQLVVISALTLINIICIYHKIFILNFFPISTYIYITLNLFMFLGYYILTRIHKIAGNHIFFVAVYLTIFAKYFNEGIYLTDNQIIYLIPIMLTLIFKKKIYTVLYSSLILFILILDQYLYQNYTAVNFILTIITFVLIVALIIIYDLWVQESHKLRIQSISENYSSTLRILGRVAELKDSETHNHLERVAIIVEKIALRLRRNPVYADYLTDYYIEDLKAASSLHDVGKIAINDNILLKPGKLTDKEFTEMKNHTIIGANLLIEAETKTNNKLYKLAIELAKYHHEKWDGSGYPEKLSHRDIPLSARIMAVADVYDALVAKRCYKKSFSHKKAYKIIFEGSGNHFDPDIIKAFTNIHHEIYNDIKDLL